MTARTEPGWRGLGPRSREQLAAVGILSPEQLRQAEPYALYRQLKAQWPEAGLNLLYALMGTQEDRDWRDIARERRSEALMRLDDMGLAPGRRQALRQVKQSGLGGSSKG